MRAPRADRDGRAVRDPSLRPIPPDAPGTPNIYPQGVSSSKRPRPRRPRDGDADTRLYGIEERADQPPGQDRGTGARGDPDGRGGPLLHRRRDPDQRRESRSRQGRAGPPRWARPVLPDRRSRRSPPPPPPRPPAPWGPPPP